MSILISTFIAIAPLSGFAIQAAPEAVVDEEKSAKADRNKRVCKKFPPKTGTRLGARKLCKTQAEWERERWERKADIDTARQRAMSGSTDP